MIKKKAKDEFWAVVRDCLIELFDFPRTKAIRETAALRKKIDSPPRCPTATSSITMSRSTSLRTWWAPAAT